MNFRTSIGSKILWKFKDIFSWFLKTHIVTAYICARDAARFLFLIFCLTNYQVLFCLPPWHFRTWFQNLTKIFYQIFRKCLIFIKKNFCMHYGSSSPPLWKQIRERLRHFTEKVTPAELMVSKIATSITDTKLRDKILDEKEIIVKLVMDRITQDT